VIQPHGVADDLCQKAMAVVGVARGQRVRAKVPHRRWKTMTFIVALRYDRVDAPWLIERPINGERFRLYVDQVLSGPAARPELVFRRCSRLFVPEL
jgi:hypothetical protein